MATYSSNDFRPGLKIMFEGEPYAIESSEFVKPGKGQAFARVKMRRLLTGSRVEKTFKSTDSAEGADVMDTNLSYLYNDGEFYHFMHQESFEQFPVEAALRQQRDRETAAPVGRVPGVGFAFGEQADGEAALAHAERQGAGLELHPAAAGSALHDH